MTWLCAALVVAALTLTGCLSREDAARHANEVCAAGHGGVVKFWYDSNSEEDYEFGCRDGYYEAHSD